MQSLPQFIPAGKLVTIPLPVPAIKTVSFLLGSSTLILPFVRAPGFTEDADASDKMTFDSEIGYGPAEAPELIVKGMLTITPSLTGGSGLVTGGVMSRRITPLEGLDELRA